MNGEAGEPILTTRSQMRPSSRWSRAAVLRLPVKLKILCADSPARRPCAQLALVASSHGNWWITPLPETARVNTMGSSRGRQGPWVV